VTLTPEAGRASETDHHRGHGDQLRPVDEMHIDLSALLAGGVDHPQVREVAESGGPMCCRESTFLSLGGVVLVITGAEASYADMAHFGLPAIVRSWLGIVFPALTLNYLGQGGLLLRSPSSAHNPFFLPAPHWALLPMVALATLATVIASQAVISVSNRT
jgi:hypothetical protein